MASQAGPQDYSQYADGGDRKTTVKILSLGLPRTGSASMAQAYRILGYKTHHGIDLLMEAPDQYEAFGYAADACFPILSSYHGRKLSQQEWDAAFDHSEALTDIAGYFGRHLVPAYPDAKVVLVERDLDMWLTSIDMALSINFAPYARFFAHFFEPLIGSRVGPASYKFVHGFFETATDNLDAARENAPRVYRRHYEAIRAMVPPERLLEFRHQDGWAPLCAFLGKPVPDVPFPHVNEAATFKKLPGIMMRRYVRRGFVLFGPWLLAAAGVFAVLAWVIRRLTVQ